MLAGGGIGTALLLAITPGRMIPSPFFVFNALLAAVFLPLAFLFADVGFAGGWWTVRGLGAPLGALFLAFLAFRLDHRDAGRFLLFAATIAGLLLGIFPLADLVFVARGLSTEVPYLFAASGLTGAALLGASTVALTLRLWCWLFPGQLHDQLIWLVRALLVMVALRFLILLAALGGLAYLDPSLASTLVPPLWTEYLGWFILRVITGVVVPTAVGAQMLRHQAERREPVPLGQLAGIFASVLVGETVAAFLLL